MPGLSSFELKDEIQNPMRSHLGIQNLYLFIRHAKYTIISEKYLSVWNYLAGMHC